MAIVQGRQYFMVNRFTGKFAGLTVDMIDDATGRVIHPATYPKGHVQVMSRPPRGNMIWDFTTETWIDDPDYEEPPRYIDARDLMDRLTVDKQVSILAATETWNTDLDSTHPLGEMLASTVRARLRLMMIRLSAGSQVDLNSQEIIDGANFMVALGLITSADKTALLA